MHDEARRLGASQASGLAGYRQLLQLHKDKIECKGTKIVFDIARKGAKTEIHFTHEGLIPAYECFNVCSDAWGSYIRGSLKSLIAKGNGSPNPKESVVKI